MLLSSSIPSNSFNNCPSPHPNMITMRAEVSLNLSRSPSDFLCGKAASILLLSSSFSTLARFSRSPSSIAFRASPIAGIAFSLKSLKASLSLLSSIENIFSKKGASFPVRSAMRFNALSFSCFSQHSANSSISPMM